MPIYLYICKSCGEHFDAYAKVADHSAACPKCGSFDKDRDFKTEFSGIGVVTDSFGEGFNVSAGVRYNGEQDLDKKMRAKGIEPMTSRSFSKTKRPLYVDESREKYHDSINSKLNRDAAQTRESNIEIE